MTDDNEGFLKRWSRLKRDADRGEALGDSAHRRDDAGGRDGLRDAPPDAMPVLPPLDTLGPDSDFSAFMHPKVAPALRRAALAKLFSSPQFKAMDGLDVYIDDYSNPAPLAPAVAAGLRHARTLLARGTAEQDSAADTAAQDATAQGTTAQGTTAQDSAAQDSAGSSDGQPATATVGSAEEDVDDGRGKDGGVA